MFCFLTLSKSQSCVYPVTLLRSQLRGEEQTKRRVAARAATDQPSYRLSSITLGLRFTACRVYVFKRRAQVRNPQILLYVVNATSLFPLTFSFVCAKSVSRSFETRPTIQPLRQSMVERSRQTLVCAPPGSLRISVADVSLCFAS